MDRRSAIARLVGLAGSLNALGFVGLRSSEEMLGLAARLQQRITPDSEANSPSTELLFFSPHQFQTVDQLCEIIIPATDTPGARAARVAEFIDLLLAENETQLQEPLSAGLKWLDSRSNELFGSDFIRLTASQQLEIVSLISSPEQNEEGLGQIFFRSIKQLTLFGYYTSKVGLEELGYSGPMGIGTYQGSVLVQNAKKDL